MRLFDTLRFLLSSNFVLAISSFLIGIASARYLGASGRGEFYLLMQYITLLSVVIAAGLHPAYQFHLSKGIFSKETTLSLIFIQFSTLAIIFFGLFYYLSFWNVAIEIIQFVINNWLIVYFGIFLEIVCYYWTAVLMTYSRGVRVTSYLAGVRGVSQLLIFLILVYFFLDEPDKLWAAITAYFIALFIRAFFSILEVGKIKMTIPADFISLNLKLYKYGAATLLFNLSVLLIFKIDTFMISEALGYKELGIYSIAVALAEVLLMIPSVIGIALFAHFPSMKNEEQILLLKRVFFAVFAMSILLSIFLYIIGPIIISPLFGEAFSKATSPFQILLPGIVAMSLNYSIANYFAGTGRPIIAAIAFFFGVIINISLNFFLIPKYGISGAAIASSISYICVTIFFLLTLKKLNKIKIYEFLSLKYDDFLYFKNTFYKYKS